MAIYIPSSTSGDYVTRSELSGYVTSTAFTNGLASKINATGTSVFSAGTITSTGLLTSNSGCSITGANLTVTGNTIVSGSLTVGSISRSVPIFQATTSGEFSVANTTNVLAQYATTTSTMTGLTVSGTGQTTFTNTSGSSQVWTVSASIAGVNGSGSTCKFSMSIFLSGASFLIDDNFPPSGQGCSCCISSAVLVPNNGYISINIYQNSGSSINFGYGAITISQS